MSKHKWWGGGGLAVFAIAGVVWIGSRDATAAKQGEHDDVTHVVTRGELVVTLVENGTLVAKESQRIKPETDGEAKITWLIDEGTEVAEGTEIVKFDTESVAQAIETLELEVTQAETQLQAAKTELEIQETDNLSTVEAAEIEVRRAEKDLERYRDGDSKQERRDLLIKIKDAETVLAKAKKRLEDSKMLLEQNYIKRNELEDHELEHEKSVVQFDGATLGLDLFEKYTYPMTLADKEVAVRKAGRELETAKKRATSRIEQRTSDVAQAQKRLNELQRRLKQKREDLDKLTLKAPVPGIVYYGDPRSPWERREIKVGASVWRGHTLMTIPDLRTMQVKIKVHEADINKLAVGQRVGITMETYPGRIFEGSVTKVAQIAGTRDEWGDDTAVKVFDVETTLKGEPGADLKPGISAKVEVFIDRKSDVIMVPRQSVGLDGSVSFCHVADPQTGAAQRRVVKVGISNANYVEILEGLESGERVLLYNPMLPAPTAIEAKSEGDEPAAAGDSTSSESAASESAANPAEVDK